MILQSLVGWGIGARRRQGAPSPQELGLEPHGGHDEEAFGGGHDAAAPPAEVREDGGEGRGQARVGPHGSHEGGVRSLVREELRGAGVRDLRVAYCLHVPLM